MHKYVHCDKKKDFRFSPEMLLNSTTVCMLIKVVEFLTLEMKTENAMETKKFLQSIHLSS